MQSQDQIDPAREESVSEAELNRELEFDPQVFSEHAEVCKVLANPKRLMILYLLSRKQRVSVGEIASFLGISMTNASQHLAKLKDRGLVTGEKDGQAVFYSIVDDRITNACDLIRSTIIDRLRGQAELANMMSEIHRISGMGQGAKAGKEKV